MACKKAGIGRKQMVTMILTALVTIRIRNRAIMPRQNPCQCPSLYLKHVGCQNSKILIPYKSHNKKSETVKFRLAKNATRERPDSKNMPSVKIGIRKIVLS